MPVWRYDSNGDLEIDSASECSAETERWFLPGGVCLTDHQKRSLEFGSQFVDATGLKAHLKPLGRKLHVLTDCSGAEAPITALYLMFGKDSIKHLSACDKAKGPQEYIKANFPDAELYHDVLSWEVEKFVDKVDIYAAGFPCKAFSRMRTFSLWLQDPEARPFYGCVSNIKSLRPRAAVMENVMGIALVMVEVKDHLVKELPEYDIYIIVLSPHQFGVNLNRERYYFLLVRKEYAIGDLEAITTQTLTDLEKKFEHSEPWQTFLLPDDHELLTDKKERRHAEKKDYSIVAKPKPEEPKWRHIHWEVMQRNKVVKKNLKKDVDAWQKRLKTPRSCQALAILSSIKPTWTACDLSQSLHRMPVIGDGAPFMCITPNGKYWIREKQRCLLGLEKLLLMGFPIHVLNVTCVSDTVLSSLGGNAMHIRPVAAALACVLKSMDIQKVATLRL
ncbi:unnamed protein product [Cladocopium goreaui]|uniref:Type II methyltransferase M.NgoBV (M.NgoBV) (Cytosine-specific methyltransferase NgoV) (M.NgoV) (Modification methylase NgoBV) n=1 Tax=Cladocopium goreaui TaxID=2562237 RepID=A0A9P1DNQ7_9DINO|nr:unnamed protein product [Cladocopium goreaui]